MWKLTKATDDEVQFLLDELNEKRLRIIEGKTHEIVGNTELVTSTSLTRPIFVVEPLFKDLNDEIDELKEKIKTLQGNCQLVVSQINYWKLLFIENLSHKLI